MIAFAAADSPPDRLVERHLEACDVCRAAVAMLAIISDSKPPSASPLLAGRFVIGETLGSGGLGLVVAAHDRRLDVDIAIKILRPDLAPQHERLNAEVRTARRIRHRNVCGVYDLGEDGQRRFITMERVHGCPLDAWAGTVADPARRLDVLRQVIDGVAAAHAEGVVHRDLKPGNIMVDNTGLAKVMDFGLAIDRDGSGGALRRVGTPAWWAPEQHRGAPVTARTDVYALGAIARWLIDRPPPRLRRWMQVCLAADPLDRFSDAGQARKALEPRRRLRQVLAAAIIVGVVGLGVAVVSESQPDATVSSAASLPEPFAVVAFAQGKGWIAAHHMTESVAPLEEAVRIDPDFAPAQQWLGYAHDWLGNAPRARRAIDEALLSVDSLPERDRLFLLAIEAKQRHDTRRAGELAARIVARWPDESNARFLGADIAYHDGRFGQAVRDFTRIVNEDPRNERAWDHLMWAEFAVNGAAAAAAIADRWRRAWPRGRVEGRAIDLMATRANAASIRMAIAALPPAKVGVQANTILAVLAFEEGRIALARRLLAPSSRAQIARRLAWIEIAAGDFERAAAHNEQAQNDAGRALIRRPQRPDWRPIWRAEALWSRLVMGDPNRPDASALVALAARSDVCGERHGCIAVALACLAIHSTPCIDALADVGWPRVRTVVRAAAARERGDPAGAAALMREAARREAPEHAPPLWLAAAFLAREAGQTTDERTDLAMASRDRFVTPYSIAIRARMRASPDGLWPGPLPLRATDVERRVGPDAGQGGPNPARPGDGRVPP